MTSTTISKINELQMKSIIDSHLGKVNMYYDDCNCSRKIHSDVFRSFYPKNNKVNSLSYDSNGDYTSQISISSLSNINFTAYMRDNFDNDMKSGESGFEIRFAHVRFTIEIGNKKIKFYKGDMKVSKEGYIRLMYSAVNEHFKVIKERREEHIRRQKEKLGFVKDDGGYKAAIANKEIVPKGKKNAGCGIIALAIATGIKASYWYDRLTAMKFRDGYKDDACDGNYIKHLNVILQELGWVKIIGDLRPMWHSNIPKKGVVIIYNKYHFCTVKDNAVRDTWDCRNFRVFGYWMKKEDNTRRVRNRIIQRSIGLKPFYQKT